MIKDDTIKLIDFEYMNKYKSKHLYIPINNNIGTRYYYSPEMLLEDEYNPFKAELWMIGVCIYVLSELTYPFYGRTQINNKCKLSFSL